MKQRIAIVAAKRTPQGRFLGGLAGYPAAALAEQAARPLLETVPADRVDLIIVGNILSAGQGMNIARQVGLALGIPQRVPAYTVNMMCGSGMQAVMLAAQAVGSGEADVVLAGGTESMSNAPYLLDRARTGYRLGDGKLTDSILRDGLVDNRLNEHMALPMERLARDNGISREQQDAFALNSHRRYFEALSAGRYDGEIVPVDRVERDEHPRADTTIEKLASLKPAFDPGGTITAGNASGINDGAAMLAVCREETAGRNGWKPLCTLTASAAVGCEPRLVGLGPVFACRKLCERSGASMDDFEVIEINEAFAAQVLSCLRQWDLPPDERINPDGGAIALGHPIAASSARLLVHLAHRIRRGEIRRGLATACVGGGMGVAVALEKP